LKTEEIEKVASGCYSLIVVVQTADFGLLSDRVSPEIS
jgi:hypothetical protein